MDAAELESRFGLPDVLAFAEKAPGMVMVQVRTRAAEATVCLQGAHLTHWRPAGEQPVLFLSERAEFVPGKAIRGGVPVVFPWFGERRDGKAGPQHGFARVSVWELAFAAVTGPADDEQAHLAFTLAPNELSRSLGFDNFRVVYRIVIGRRLTLQLTVANDAGSLDAADAGASASETPRFEFEEAFHTYFAVTDARRVAIDGLGGTEYLDKVDGGRRKVQAPGLVTFQGRTDRAYLNTDAACVLRDEVGGRKIVVQKGGSRSTVVWNPGQELTAKMADMEPDGWLRMAAIETGNVDEDAVSLQPGETHTMHAEISVEKDGIGG